MCILCVVQRWSRKVATMLPWLVIPLILLWALSQLLPPNFRFEVTSPRLACVVVLLITLLWYEILMPRLSCWRARRSARIREERRSQAIELQKLKKSAMRRCRNCLTPYRDQNPGAGKFMCSYCGHISKRPVLDLHGWHDWSGESVSIPRYWGNGGHGGDERCLTEKSYSGAMFFGCRVKDSFFLSVRWVWRKVFRVVSRESDSADGESKGSSNKRDNGESFHESRGEKARRKAEEKRQARMEREMLEEEERKQREEVARLVEERRRLRDEKLEAEKLRSKGLSSVDGERESRKETERRRHERRRDKDKGSSKSNSDGEELEKRVSRETEKKREFDKKSETERQKAIVENLKTQALEGVNGNKVASSKTRYFDRMKGTFLSSSRSSFFGRNAQAIVTVSKVNKPTVGFVDHGQNSVIKKDSQSAVNASGKSTPNGDHSHVGTDVQPRAIVPKKSWHQLFTRSSAVSPDPDTNNITVENHNCQLEARNAADPRVFTSYATGNQFNSQHQQPHSGYSSPNGLLNRDLVSNVAADSMFPPIKEPMRNSAIEDAELFEDPCYVPDPLSRIGPISNQLDKFPLDLGTGFIEDRMVDGPRVLKNVTASAEGSKPAPIESPLSRIRGSEERHVSCTPKSQQLHASKLDESSNAQGPGTWQMWGSPLAQDGLGLAGGPSSWFSPLVQSKPNLEYVSHSLGHNPIIHQILTEGPLPSILTPQKASVPNLHTGGVFSPLGPGLNGNDPWVQNSPFQSPLTVDAASHFLPLDLIDNISQNDVTDGSLKGSAAVHPFEVPLPNGWSNEEWATTHDMNDIPNSTASAKTQSVGGLFSTAPDVHPVWSYNLQ